MFFPFTTMQLFAQTAMTIIPDTVVPILVMVAFLFGPCIFICLYSTLYIIGSLLQYSTSDNLSLAELHPDTHVVCFNGLCYLHMFCAVHHLHLITELGHFPTILALTSIPKLYQRKIKGKLELFHFYFSDQIYCTKGTVLTLHIKAIG